MDAETAKENVVARTRTESSKQISPPTSDEDDETTRQKFVASLRQQASGDASDAEKIVGNIVERARRSETIGERIALLELVFARDADGNGGASSRAWDVVQSATRSRETLAEMHLTATTYESARVARKATPRSNALRMPIGTVAEARAFATRTCSADKTTIKRLLTHAESRRSYAMASNAEKIERLWKIVDWLSCD